MGFKAGISIFYNLIHKISQLPKLKNDIASDLNYLLLGVRIVKDILMQITL